MGAWIASISARKLGLLDYPNDRSSHMDPTPKGGGVGILAAFVFGSLWWHIPLIFWVPASAVSLVSLVGDFKDISIKIRLVIQVVSAAILSYLVFIAHPSLKVSTGFSVLLFMLGTLYVVATANCYNFMDGINGIAGLTGTIAFSFLGTYGILEDKDATSAAAALGIAAACSGFLPFNFPRAKVFMGDVGSVLLGFLFASWALWQSKSLLEFVVFVSFLFPFYIDELNTQLTRITERERITDPHCRHIYQILVKKTGLSHGTTTVIYGFLQIFVAISVWMLMRAGIIAVISFLAGFSGLFFLGATHIRRRWEAEKHFGLEDRES